jgi:protein ImuB
MFACIQGRSVSKLPAENDEFASPLVDLAFTFSPLVELILPETVVLDISGQDLLFGRSPLSAAAKNCPAEMTAVTNVAEEISRRAKQLKMKIDVAVAANPDVAIHAVRSFPGTTIINRGEESLRLAQVAIRNLDFTLARIDPHRAEEIQETFALWGIRTFADLAKLPLAGVAERLGQEGVRLQKLAQGKTERQLNLVRPPIGFVQSLELEHPVEELEPLSFILSRLLNQLCANLLAYALATNELKLTLVTDPRHVEVAAGSTIEGGDCLHERTLTLPVPVQNPKTLLRLLLFDIEAQPPQAPVVAVTIRADPVRARASQRGLFIPLAPEPEKLEITLARLGKLVGQDHVGSPELLDTHRPDAFRLKRFSVTSGRNRKSGQRQSATANRQQVMGFRVFRPPWHADVQTIRDQPVRINAHGANSSDRLRGKVGRASGPWRASGEWWRADVWARDEWDVAVKEANNQPDEVICRIYRDLISDEWFVAGIYD